jgi:acyl carrier protein
MTVSCKESDTMQPQHAPQPAPEPGHGVHPDPVIDKLRRIVADDLDVNLTYDEVDPTVPLFEEGLALDSVVLVELISFVEKRFRIELRDDALDMETFETLETLARVIRRELQLRLEVQSRAQAQGS